MKSISILPLVFLLNACLSTTTLQGGDVYFEKEDEKILALEELSKIDLIYELDPKKKGFCNEPTYRGRISDTIKIKCALDVTFSPDLTP
ncbi:hypothetical protein [Bowmanella dokdonensis]